MSISIRGRVIARAYTDTHALDVDCPTCLAPVGQYCTIANDIGGGVRWRKTPCLARMSRHIATAAKTVLPRAGKNIGERPGEDRYPTIDFAEPRHHDG